jgi:acyl-CoA thioester hydrolase
VLAKPGLNNFACDWRLERTWPTVKGYMEPVYRFDIIVPVEAVDRNRHVNNVAYVQWMQDAALRHSAATGCTRLTEALGATWVARMHRIEYLSPAFAEETVTVLTWVADFRKVRSLRRYRMIRAADQKVLAEGETDWVLVDASTGRPRAIPPELVNLFELVPDEADGTRRKAHRLGAR